MPEYTTQRGLSVWAESAEALTAIDRFEVSLLGMTPEAEAILGQAKEFPETPLIQAYAALCMIYAQAAPEMVEAGVLLENARRCLYGASLREIRFIEAIEHFQRKEFAAALDHLEQLTKEHPRDLVAAKVAEFLYYCLGQHYCGERFLAHMLRLSPANGNHPGFLSMLSFAHELCGNYSEAREAAEESLRQEPGQPWSHHTLAHVLIRTEQAAEGVREMARFAPFWKDCARGIYAHNAWHQSLFSLEETDWERTNEILRQDIWGQSPDYVGEQIDAIALLWRMDIAGQPQDDVWADVAAHCAPHAGECLIPFLEGQIVYALARTGQSDAANASVAKARQRAAQDDLEARTIWRPVGADFVAACEASGRGDAQRAAELFDPIAERLPMVGGSDAQDDLFRLAYYNALAESGRQTDARNYYGLISPDKASTPLDELLLAKCQG